LYQCVTRFVKFFLPSKSSFPKEKHFSFLSFSSPAGLCNVTKYGQVKRDFVYYSQRTSTHLHTLDIFSFLFSIPPTLAFPFWSE
jgi:hypothetical protein